MTDKIRIDNDFEFDLDDEEGYDSSYPSHEELDFNRDPETVYLPDDEDEYYDPDLPFED